VIAPANTGKESNNKIAVIHTAQEYKLHNSILLLISHKLKKVVMKLIAPKIELAPAKCKEKITKSTPSSG